jgi:hypothetical protein
MEVTDMKPSSKFAAFFVAFSLFAASALASPADSALSSLLKARESLVTLLATTDKAAQNALQSEIGKASKEVDGSLKAAISDKTVSAEQASKYKAFKEIWEAFKKTRDSEIIPAIKAGKVEDAKALAKGVQAERFAKMKELLAAAGAK